MEPSSALLSKKEAKVSSLSMMKKARYKPGVDTSKTSGDHW